MPAPRPKVQITFQPQDATVPASDESTAPAGHEITTSLAPGARWLLLALLLAGLAIASAARAVNGKFLPQDDTHVTDNVALRAWQGLRPIWLSPQRMAGPYPIAFTCYLIEYRIFRASPTGYRAINLLLHAFVTVLLWTLLKKLEVPGAYFAAALFAVHPLQVATVAWIAQQKVLWCAVFYLAGLLVYFRFCGINPAPLEQDELDASMLRLPRSRAALYVLSIALLLLALLSQAIAVTFVPVVLITIWWERARITRADWRPLILPGVLSVAAAITFAVIEYRHGARGASYPTLLERVQLIGLTFWTDLRRIVAPIALTYLSPRFALRASATWLYLPTLAVVGLFVALWRLRRTLGRGPFAAAALFGVLVAPYCGIVNFQWMEQSFVGDHLLYLACSVPMIALATTLAQLIRRANWNLPPLVAPAAGAVLVIALISISVVRAGEYQSPGALWTAALARAPRLAAAHNALGILAIEAGDRAGASRHFVQALEQDEGNITAHLKIAQLYRDAGQRDLALGEYQQVLLRDPDNAEAHFGLALILAAQNDSRGAIREYEKVLSVRPDDSRAYTNLGQLHEERNEFEEAIRCYREAVRVDPRNVQARMALGLLLYRGGAVQEAMDQMRLVCERLDPKNDIAWMNAGVFAAAAGMQTTNPAEKAGLYSMAAEYLEGAVKLNRQFGQAYLERGKVLMKLSLLQPKQPALASISEAIASFRRAAELKPDDAQPAQLAQSAELERRRRQDSRE